MAECTEPKTAGVKIKAVKRLNRKKKLHKLFKNYKQRLKQKKKLALSSSLPSIPHAIIILIVFFSHTRD